MAGVLALSLEHVLAKQAEGIPVGVPIPLGLTLYHSLKKRFKLAILANSTREQAAQWCHTNNMFDHPYLLTLGDVPEVVAGDFVKTRIGQVRQLRRSVDQLDLVIDASPEVIRQLMIDGVPSLLFAHPQYARPEFRPDTQLGARPWDALQAEIEAEHGRRRSDTRIDVDTARFDDDG